MKNATRQAQHIINILNEERDYHIKARDNARTYNDTEMEKYHQGQSTALFTAMRRIENEIGIDAFNY